MKQGTYENPLTLEEFLDNFREAQEVMKTFPVLRTGKWTLNENGAIRFIIPTRLEYVDCFCPLTFQLFVQNHKVISCAVPSSAAHFLHLGNFIDRIIISADVKETQSELKLRQQLLEIVGLT